MGPSMALVLHGGVGGVRWCFVAPLVGCPLHAYLLTSFLPSLLACLLASWLAGWLACLLACFLVCFSGLFLSLFVFFWLVRAMLPPKQNYAEKLQ